MDESSFPRGRRVASGVNPTFTAAKRGRSKHRAKKEEEDAVERKKMRSSHDFLFGNAEEDAVARKKDLRKERSENVEKDSVLTSRSMLPLGGGGVIQPRSSRSKLTSKENGSHSEPVIENLSYNKLVSGMKLLGCVREVYDNFIVYSLPNMWTGYMLLNQEKSTSLVVNDCRKMVLVGQYMSVVIVKAVKDSATKGHQPKIRIQVTCRPDLVNPKISTLGTDNEDLTSSTKNVNKMGRNSAKNAVWRGQVMSVEDHGVVVDLGIGRQGFLKFEDIEENEYKIIENMEDEGDDEAEDDEFIHSKGLVLRKGRILDFLVCPTSSNSKVLPLLLPTRQTLAKHVLATTPTLADLSAGSLVEAKIESIVQNGLCVTFGNGVFRGAIHVHQLGGYWIPEKRLPSTEWRRVFQDAKTKTLMARIIAVDAPSKVVRLSLQPHILFLTQVASSLPPVGTIIQKAVVVRQEAGLGALLALPSLQEDADERTEHTKPMINAFLYNDDSYMAASLVQTCHVHISNATDEKSDETGKTSEVYFTKEFAPSTVHNVRILNTSHWIDGVASGASAESIISAQVLSYADLVIGKCYRQVPVCAHMKGGSVLVDFGMGVRGVIPVVHLFDQAGTNDYRDKLRQIMFALDAKVDILVLSVNVKAKRCIVSAKKSLIKANDIIKSYDDIKIGQTAIGFVQSVKDFGLSVAFCNDVHGRVTARCLAVELGIENHKENYQVGDVVQCRVINIKNRVNGKTNEEVGADEFNEDDDGHLVRSRWDLTLSLRLNAVIDSENTNEAEIRANLSAKLQIHAGAVLPLRSLRVAELQKGKELEKGGFVPGFAIVSIKSKYLVQTKTASVPEYFELKLPFDQLVDDYNEADIQSASSLDALAEKLLTVGKKINRKAIVLLGTNKLISEYANGMGKLTVVSIRPKFIEAAESMTQDKSVNDGTIILPDHGTHLFVGARVLGYVANIDLKHGAFIYFLDNLCGILPKMSGGLKLARFSTVCMKIVSLDVTTDPIKMLLSKEKLWKQHKTSKLGIKPGDKIAEVMIEDINFVRCKVKILDDLCVEQSNIRARLHCTMTQLKPLEGPLIPTQDPNAEQSVSLLHPFFDLKVGSKLRDLRVTSVHNRESVCYVELTNRTVSDNGTKDAKNILNDQVGEQLQIETGRRIVGIVSVFDENNFGLRLHISPNKFGFLPALEISDNVDVLNRLLHHFPIGCSLECVVIGKASCFKPKSSHLMNRPKSKNESAGDIEKRDVPLLSFLQRFEDAAGKSPASGDLVTGRIQCLMSPTMPPAIMLELRKGFSGRCCITELDEPEDWKNMPLGHVSKKLHCTKNEFIAKDEDDIDELTRKICLSKVSLSINTCVTCRILEQVPNVPSLFDVSLRASRLRGLLNDDEIPEVGQMIHAYVVNTTKKGCFLRLSRRVEGRVLLKELSDTYLTDPAALFPMGRLVIGKVKALKDAKQSHPYARKVADVDLRESVLRPSQTTPDIVVGRKYKGIVSRIEDFGVFVKLNNTCLSGLVHKSECSDKYFKEISELYQPGDLVKVLVLRKDDVKKQLSLSMKASHFFDDEDSDDDNSLSHSDEDSHLKEEVPIDDLSSVDENDVDNDFMDDASICSHNEKKEGSIKETEGITGVDSRQLSSSRLLDTKIEFNWNGLTPHSIEEKMEAVWVDEDEGSSSIDENNERLGKISHRSRRKHAQRQRQEYEISKREAALADGTADDNPETAADFERLLASNPNSSELWIKFMAFHLSLADVQAARQVSERAFHRIEFRLEREKLNVWCALLALEMRFGSEQSLQDTIDRACNHNNAKHVYLRVCEMLVKDASSGSSSLATDERVNEMFTKMCKKFKNKKKVWLSHIEYLLKSGKQDDGETLLRRSLQSLPQYKHVETMSKYAQLLFEYGNAERATTLFDGLLQKNRKRLDLFFVLVDKVIKYCDIETARALFWQEVKAGSGRRMKLSDKQMKKLFRKWFAFEEQHGTSDSKESVKNAARAYVEESS